MNVSAILGAAATSMREAAPRSQTAQAAPANIAFQQLMPVPAGANALPPLPGNALAPIAPRALDGLAAAESGTPTEDLELPEADAALAIAMWLPVSTEGSPLGKGAALPEGNVKLASGPAAALSAPLPSAALPGGAPASQVAVDTAVADSLPVDTAAELPLAADPRAAARPTPPLAAAQMQLKAPAAKPGLSGQPETLAAASLLTNTPAAAEAITGAGLERLLSDPAVAQDRLFVARPGGEALPDPRYTLDASAGPQRLAETAAQRLSWMAGEKVSRADLALNPPELGSVDVQMEIEGDQVRIQMTAATGAAKEMLDQALPRLRELFAQEGLQLTHADVSQQRGQGERERTAEEQNLRQAHGGLGADAEDGAESDSAPPRMQQRQIGLLDHYA